MKEPKGWSWWVDTEKGAGMEWGCTVDSSSAPYCAGLVLFLAVLATSAASEVRILGLEQ